MPSEHALPQPGDWVAVEATRYGGGIGYAIAQVVSVTAKMAVVHPKAHNKQSHPLSNITTMAGEREVKLLVEKLKSVNAEKTRRQQAATAWAISERERLLLAVRANQEGEA